MTKTKPKVLLIGWDAADWKVISPLMDAGKMPNLQAFVEEGTMGNLASLDPMYSPMLWTSIATGKRPYKHGVLGFIEPDPVTGNVRPVSSHSRKVKALWNMLNQEGLQSNVVAWWPSHPVEPINGVMVSNHYQDAPKDPAKWRLVPGTVHPERLQEPLTELRVHPSEFTGNELLPFLPTLGKIDTRKDRRPSVVAKLVAHCVSVQAAATAIMQLEPWDFMGVYFDGIDHFGHGFMKYHPPRRKHISEKDFEHYHGVIEAAYRFHDQMLGTLLKLAGDDTHVFLISDHGFHPDHLRPTAIPVEPAGPAAEHRPFGIFAARGPGIRRDEILYGASLLDIAPTILSLFGLPVGNDMDGRPLTELFLNPLQVQTIPSWEEREGNDGRHLSEEKLDEESARAAVERLAELGYVDPEATGKSPEAVERAKRELSYNLARAYLDGRKPAEAAKILEELWLEYPAELRFPRYLATSCQVLGRTKDCRAVVERMVEIRRELRGQAKALLQEVKGQKLRRGARRKLQRIRSIASEPAQDDDYLLGLLDFAEGDFDAAAQRILSPGTRRAKDPRHHEQVGDLFLQMKKPAKARESYAKALELDPESEHAWLGNARTFLEEGDFGQAVETALRAIGLRFQMPRAHLCLGKALLGGGDFRRAEEAFRVALHQFPGLVEARQCLLRLYENDLADPELAERERKVLDFIESRHSERKRTRKMITNPQPDGTVRVPDSAKASIGETAAALLAPPSEGRKGKREARKAPILIVSGLPRSGTSMLMQMLAAAGLDILSDGERRADPDNPRGYYEYEPVKRLAADASWLPEASGRAVKIVAPLLKHIPARVPCQVIFLLRDIDEVLRSQETMLSRSGKKVSGTDPQMKRFLKAELETVMRSLENRPNLKLLLMEYPEVVKRPKEAAEMIAKFLGKDLPVKKMASAVKGDLYRQRKDAQG